MGHLTRAKAHLEVVLWSIRRKDPSSIAVPNLKRIALGLFVQKLYKVTKIFELVVTPATHVYTSFYGPSSLCTEFEVDSSIRSSYIRVPKFRNWSRDHKPRLF